MTKWEAAELILSRDPKKVDYAAELCSGINCYECFDCHPFDRPSLSERDAAIWLINVAADWLAANPESEPAK